MQANARESGYDNELAHMPTTFDPGHDTPAVFESSSADVGAVPVADSRHALRPADERRARLVPLPDAGLSTRPVTLSARTSPPWDITGLREAALSGRSLAVGSVVRCLVGDDHVVGVALLLAGRGDADELGALLERRNRGGPDVAHPGLHPADELV